MDIFRVERARVRSCAALMILLGLGALFFLGRPQHVLLPDASGLSQQAFLEAGLRPSGKPVLDDSELFSMLREQNRAEANSAEEDAGPARGRLNRLQRAGRILRPSHTRSETLPALHVYFAAEAMRLLAGDSLYDATARANAADILGSFPRMLERYSLYLHGTRIAPRSMVRVLYLARLNAMLGLKATDYFSKAEVRLYFGWLAFYAEIAPPQRRLQALRKYYAAGGSKRPIAEAYLLQRAGYEGPSKKLVQEYFSESPSLKFRNAF